MPTPHGQNLHKHRVEKRKKGSVLGVNGTVGHGGYFLCNFVVVFFVFFE